MPDGNPAPAKSIADERITLRFDGGSRGNPGPAGIGVVLEAEDGTPIYTLGRFIGNATNNVAEYKALLTGLEQATRLGVRKLRVLGDSELVIRQMLGQYKVRNETLKPLYEESQLLLKAFPKSEISHNLRGHNTLAYALANLAMDRKRDVSDADLPAGGVSDASFDEPPSEEAFECPRCACELKITKLGEPLPNPRRFICRCGTPMRPK